MARESSRVFRIFVTLSFSVIHRIKRERPTLRNVGRLRIIPITAHFGRFGGISRESGPTDRPAAERPVKRKSGENKCLPVRPRSAKNGFLMAEKEIYKNYQLFFW